MKIRDSVKRGQIGELLARAAFLEKSFDVSVPLYDRGVDLVVRNSQGVTYNIQIKTKFARKKGKNVRNESNIRHFRCLRQPGPGQTARAISYQHVGIDFFVLVAMEEFRPTVFYIMPIGSAPESFNVFPWGLRIDASETAKGMCREPSRAARYEQYREAWHLME